MTAPAALLELHSRVTASRAADDGRMRLAGRLRSRLFDKQRAFIDDAAKNKTAQCTRRAGKTVGTAVDEVLAPLETPGSRALYATLTRERAKDLLWSELRRLDHEEQIGSKFNEVELTMTLPEGLGGGSVKLTGADKAKEIHKQRGSKYRRARIDEAQAFGLYLKEFIEDVIEPTLMDQQGDVGLLGTPGPVCAGYYHDVCVGKVKGWSVHRWSVLDNPFMPHAKAWIEQKRKERGWDETHPTFLREWCGQWVNDSGALVYKYDDARNGYEVLPNVGGWAHVLVIDLGSGGENDPMAASVLSWTPALPDLYVSRNKKLIEATTTRELMALVARWRDELGGFVRHIIDTGGGGKLTAQDLTDRYGMLFEAAQKTEKHLHQRLFNDDLLAGRIKILRGSDLAEEMKTLPKDPEDETKEDPRFPNHSCDTALYGWRFARHFWHVPEVAPPKPNTREAHEAWAKQMEEAEAAALTQQLSQEWWER